MNMDTILVSTLIILSLILTGLNWVSLKETITIRKESVKVKKALGDADEPSN